MFIEEAVWIKDTLEKLHLRKGQVVLDIGAKNEEYRFLLQPFIDYFIFRPLRKIGLKIIYIDLVKDEGVDIALDIASPDFNKVKNRIEKGDVILCTSLLEHVPNRKLIIERIGELAKPGAVLIVSVPYIWPYHPDPIDTMFRPTDTELLKEFPAEYYEKIASNILSGIPNFDYFYLKRNKNSRIRIINRLLRKVGFELKHVLPEHKASVLALKYVPKNFNYKGIREEQNPIEA